MAKLTFLRIISKNFKLLSRSRSSAFILFVGPILIIALVGFFFSGKSSYDLSIGYYSPKVTPLTQEFIVSLEESQFVAVKYSSEEACVEKIKQGMIHTCIIFPQDFEIRNQRPSELKFVVDYSRINLVYKVIDAVSGIIDVETKSVSASLSGVLLSNINQTVEELIEYEGLERNLSELDKLAQVDIDAATAGISSMQFETESVKTSRIRDAAVLANMSLTEYEEQANGLLWMSEELWDELDGYIDSNKSDELRAQLDEINASMESLANESGLRMQALSGTIDDLDYYLEQVVEQMSKNDAIAQASNAKLAMASEKLNQLKKDINVIITRSQATRKRLGSIGVTRADIIASPVNTKIEPLVAETSNLQFTFPFLVVLIIMFASLMIASTLVIFEKSSRALFRNFMAPISEKMFILASFATVTSIVLFQAFVILLISQLALSMSLFSRISHVLVVLLVAVVFFSVLGMLIGYLFSSQEGAVMASLVVASVFLFLSNLVVPLESIAPALSGIIRFNPFIIFSDMLRKSLLFGMGIRDSILALGVLLWIALSLLALILLVKGFFTRHRVRMPGDGRGGPLS